MSTPDIHDGSQSAAVELAARGGDVWTDVVRHQCWATWTTPTSTPWPVVAERAAAPGTVRGGCAASNRRSRPLHGSVLAAITGFIALPHGEELLRCLQSAPARHDAVGDVAVLRTVTA
jgi:hypothetical protein